MDNRTKNALYSLLLIAAILVVYFIRKDGPEKQPELTSLSGQTMGTIVYNVKYFDDSERNFKLQIDSLLQVFNQSLNTYIPESEISQFNRDSVFQFDLPFFYESLEKTKKLTDATNGAFNPAIMPLVNLWGFGPEEVFRPDSALVDSLKKLVDYELIQFNEEKVWKLNRNVSLDFSASAKGQGVDAIAEFLEDKGVINYFVEIGGEVRTGGTNIEANRGWLIGIIDPESNEVRTKTYATIELVDKAMATSGNYYNYRIIDGLRYSHTIDPSSGYPIVLPILSATVIADDCLSADALATAFMVMGHEKAIEFLENNLQYGGLLIYTSDDGEIEHYMTEGINVNIKN